MLPFSLLYAGVSNLLRILAKPYKAKIPLICVGNISMGGTGKTPTAMAIGEYLKAQGLKVAFITRGYKGAKKDLWVNDKSVACMVGDEPLLLASVAPTYVCSSRVAAVKKLENKFDVLVFDDALQYNKLLMDFSIMVIDGGVGLGNGGIFPAGHLRESLASGIKRTQMALLVGEDKQNVQSKILKINKNYPIIKGVLEPIQKKVKAQKIIAFAGIGRPQKFFDTLKNLGYIIFKKYEFADHHFFNKIEIEKIVEEAKKNKLEIFTTQKDFVRLDKEQQKNIKYVAVKMQLENKFFKMLNEVICKKQ